MRTAILLGLLAFVDCVMSGFRMAAGRNGLLAKRSYYLRAVARAAFFGAVLVALHVALVAIFCWTSPDPAAAWAVFLEAARPLVWIFGVFASLIFGAFAFYFAPIGDFRVLTNVIVFGPLTLARRLVVLGGLLFAVVMVKDARVGVVAVCAAISMSAFEPVMSLRYRDQWRALVGVDG
jgi:hypothetical protein